VSAKQLFQEFELRVLLAIDAIESGNHEGDWVYIKLPGALKITYKLIPSVERLHNLIDQCKKERIFSAHNRGRPRGPRNMPKLALKEFVDTGETENAIEYARLTNQAL